MNEGYGWSDIKVFSTHDKCILEFKRYYGDSFIVSIKKEKNQRKTDQEYLLEGLVILKDCYDEFIDYAR